MSKERRVCPIDGNKGRYLRSVGSYAYIEPVYRCANGHLFYANGNLPTSQELSGGYRDGLSTDHGSVPWRNSRDKRLPLPLLRINALKEAKNKGGEEYD